MSEQVQIEENQEHQEPAWRLPVSGGTLITAEALSLMVHGGWLGAGAGLLGSAFVYLKGQQFIDAARELFPETARGHLPFDIRKHTMGGRSFKDRLFGNFPEEARPHEDGAQLSETQMEALQPKPRAQLAPPTLGKGSLRAPASRSFFTLSDVLAKGFRPSLQKIYLATLDDGTDVFVPATKLCHGALAGLTRGGKGHMKRSLMAQLCFAGAEVYLLDPHYTQYDRESEDPTGRPCPEDWTPYNAYLQNDPSEQIPVIQKYQVIGGYLQAAKQELDRRLERYGRSLSVGRPVFIFIDELPAIVDNVPEAPGYLKSILREGAKVGVYVVALSQDFLVKTLFPNEGGAVRDCFRTVLYVGGDAQTARILLDMPAKDVPENRLGKGRVMLRCDTVRPAQEARVPYVDNEALCTLLGPSTYVEPDEEDEMVRGLIAGPQLRTEREEIHTEKLPTPTTRRVARSSYDAYQARKTTHRVAASAPRVQGTPTRVQEPQRGQDDLPPELRRAYDAFESQMSYRDLGLRLGVSKDTAGKWVLRLQDKGYISEEGIKRV